MKEYGFGSKEVIAFIAVVGISLGIVGFLYQDISKRSMSFLDNTVSTFSSKNTNSKKVISIEADSYNQLEDIISEKSIPYFVGNSNNYVSLLTLIQNEYIDTIYSLDKDKTDCTGYVEYNQDNKSSKTYLMCGTKYTTKGYDISKEIDY